MRPSKRKHDELRSVFLGPGFSKHAEGSCFVKIGDTHIICTATIEDKVPPFLRNTGSGWITAEYGMLPRSTHDRIDREASKGKQSGRTVEIQRLIGRALRAVTDLKAMGERQIRIDCDVIQADGGTRTASITGAYVALHIAMEKLMKQKKLAKFPLIEQVAAISCGVIDGEVVLDIDYEEDSKAQVDSNFVMTSTGKIVEIQTTAEQSPFERDAFDQMFAIAKKGIDELLEHQKQVLKL